MKFPKGTEVRVDGLDETFYVDHVSHKVPGQLGLRYKNRNGDRRFIYVSEHLVERVLPQEPVYLGKFRSFRIPGTIRMATFVRVDPGFGSNDPKRRWFMVNQPQLVNGKVEKRWYTWAELNA